MRNPILKPYRAKFLNPPIKSHGGKKYLARRIINLFPKFHKGDEKFDYLEPFCRGASVFLNINPEIINQSMICDKDLDIARMWTLLKWHGTRIQEVLRQTPYSEHQFRLATTHLNAVRLLSDGKQTPIMASVLDQDNLDWVASFIANNRMSRGGLGKDFAWSKRLRGGMPGDVNAWHNMTARMLEYTYALRNTVISAFEFQTTLMHSAPTFIDNPRGLIYCDPPYMHSTRTVKDSYNIEMTDDEHCELALILNRPTNKAKILISGYRSDEYDTWYAEPNWHRVDFSMPNHSGQGKKKQRRVECVWKNY